MSKATGVGSAVSHAKVLEGIQTSCLPLEMTAFLFTERNADADLSSAAFLTVWRGAREGW